MDWLHLHTTVPDQHRKHYILIWVWLQGVANSQVKASLSVRYG